MKVQLTEQAIRWRIDEAELACLLQGDAVVLEPCAGIFTERFEICCSEHADAELRHGADAWSLQIPASQLRAYVERLPCRDAMQLQVKMSSGAIATMQVEVDIRDSVRSGRVRRRSIKSS